ncbi:MAG: threonine synthase [Chitinophagaceae bacterium]
MRFYSTNRVDHSVDLEEAIFSSLPADNGLYMPEQIPVLASSFLKHLEHLSFPEIANTVAQALLKDSIEPAALGKIVEEAINFPAPLVPIGDGMHALELFHGPSLAFKDFGARFMSRVMNYFLERKTKKIHILVATSGDTGGAVALGFLKVPNIQVTILYPAGKVSGIQEKQLTTLGNNITAIQVKGSFDDCQSMVKKAFLDPDLNGKWNLSSANSINIARLIPQTFYYFQAFSQLKHGNKEWVVSVPSGNYGNLMAGLMAWKMGLPVKKFIASSNINDVIPQYLRTGVFHPKPSLSTLSNAMDVGNPSNFARILNLFGNDLEKIRSQVEGFSFSDQQTRVAIRSIFDLSGQIYCPHTAVAYLGLEKYRSRENNKNIQGVFLSTAHSCKFPEVLDPQMLQLLKTPPQVQEILHRPEQFISMSGDFLSFKAWLLEQSN